VETAKRERIRVLLGLHAVEHREPLVIGHVFAGERIRRGEPGKPAVWRPRREAAAAEPGITRMVSAT
jgi:hypothetical protein